MTLLVVGLVISIPLSVFGSQLILQIMERVLVIIVLGAALLDYLAGGMLFSDLALLGWVAICLPWHGWTVPDTAVVFSLPGLVRAAALVVIGRRSHK